MCYKGGEDGMLLKYESKAQAGQQLSFTAFDFVGPAHLTVHIGAELVAVRECASSPCQGTVFIPAESAGRILSIFAEDDSRSAAQLSMRVAG